MTYSRRWTRRPTTSLASDALAVILFVALVAGFVIGICVLFTLAGCGGDTTTAAAATAPIATTPAPATMAVIFRWSGGGPGNDSRNSRPFTVTGGHQVISVNASAMKGPYVFVSESWYIESVDGSNGGDMLNPPHPGRMTSDLYLSPGRYYVSANTCDLRWSMTIEETS